MKRSTMLVVLAFVLGAVAAVTGFMAWLTYTWQIDEHGSTVAEATVAVRAWTTVAFTGLAAAVLLAVAAAYYSSADAALTAGGQSSSGSGAGSGASGDL